MVRSLRISVLVVAAQVLVPLVSTPVWAVENRNGDVPKNSGQNLPETQKLEANDNILPTQNRTQAMRLEAETGHINPQEDAQLAPTRRTIAPTPFKTSPPRRNHAIKAKAH